MGWIVYLLECADTTLYCGITNDMAKRLKTHNAGKASKYTRARLPVKVVYQDFMATKSEALKREYKIKQMNRTQKFKLIELSDFSQSL